MSLYVAIIVTFVLSHLLRGVVVDHVVVVDPASNHLGWLLWGALISVLRWQWWTAILLRLPPSRPRWFQSIFLALLLAVDAYISYNARYSWLIYGSALSAHGHHLMMALHTLLSIGQSATLFLLAVVAARRPVLLPVLAIICALKVFVGDLPLPEDPFARETFASGLPTVVYLVIAAAVTHFTAGPSSEVGRPGDPPLPGSSRRSSGTASTASSG